MSDDGAVRRRVAERFAARGASPCTAAMAFALMRARRAGAAADDDARVAACVLVAWKFEEVCYLHAKVAARDAFARCDLTRADVVAGERRLLADLGYVLPYRTRTRAVLHTLRATDAFYDEAAYVVLWAGAEALYAPEAWAELLRAARHGGRVAVVLQALALSFATSADRLHVWGATEFVRRVCVPRVTSRAAVGAKRRRDGA